VKYRALTKLKQDLCVPHTVSQTNIFFVFNLRSTVGSIKARGPAWFKLVADVAYSVAHTAEFTVQQRLKHSPWLSIDLVC